MHRRVFVLRTCSWDHLSHPRIDLVLRDRPSQTVHHDQFKSSVSRTPPLEKKTRTTDLGDVYTLQCVWA